jgi:hypothetical protein
VARPDELQRLQLRTGNLTRTCPFPLHPGQSFSSNGLPAQNPQVLSKYADMRSYWKPLTDSFGRKGLALGTPDGGRGDL